MGMFDTVYATCHNCGGVVKFQSKAGECRLREYPSDWVPAEIAKDIEGDESCCEDCGQRFRIGALPPDLHVQMVVQQVDSSG